MLYLIFLFLTSLLEQNLLHIKILILFLHLQNTDTQSLHPIVQTLNPFNLPITIPIIMINLLLRLFYFSISWKILWMRNTTITLVVLHLHLVIVRVWNVLLVLQKLVLKWWGLGFGVVGWDCQFQAIRFAHILG